MQELKDKNIIDIHASLIAKEFSSEELTNYYLDNIERKESDIHAFVTITRKEAVKQARAVDEKIAKGEDISTLAGIPYAVKDLFMTRGIKTTCSSKILENYIPPYESTTTKRLSKAGAVLIGKTNMDEFAMGTSTENSGFFATHNPHDLDRVPGGSSGGSAAAIAADEAVYSLGTDTGGSIRQPAAFCGVVGLKPTYGRTSRYGVASMASSLDTIGHFARSVFDASLILEHIAGRDDMDATTSNLPIEKYAENIRRFKAKGIKVGIPSGVFSIEGISPDVKEAVQKSIKTIEEITGNSVKEVQLPHIDKALSAYYIIVPSEVSSNLARYDGIRYGASSHIKGVLEKYIDTRSSGLGDEVKRRILLGTFALSHGYYDAYYKKAQAIRALIADDYKKAFAKVDVIISPVTPNPPFKIGEKISDPMSLYLEDIFTLPINLAGLPALSLPCMEGSRDIPIGFQIIGDLFAENKILGLGHSYEGYFRS